MTEHTYVKQGNGTAVHIAYVYDGRMEGRIATLCDRWVHNHRIRKVEADAATCKRCLALASTQPTTN